MAVDLGGRTTKAVLMQRSSAGVALQRYALLDAPFQKSITPDTLAEHLGQIMAALESKTKHVSLAIGANESLLRHTEMPQMPVSDMRQILKVSAKSYLQQDLPNHVFDCQIVLPRKEREANKETKTVGSGGPNKFKILVAGAKRQLVSDIQTAVKNAGLRAVDIVPGVIGPVNTFEAAMPQVFAQGVVALVDIGFLHTTICLLDDGELVLSRVVNIGGDKLTNGLVEMMGISYAEAEGIKVGMAAEVQSSLESLIAPLGAELRASIDFFEHQQEKHVSQVYLSGASSRSEFVVKILEAELMVPCKTWSPITGNIQLALPPQQLVNIEQDAGQLQVAIGTAVTALS